MTGTGLRLLRRKTGLSQLRFGRALGLKRNTVIRYEGSKRKIPKAVAIAAHCVVYHGSLARRRGGRGR